LAADFPSDCVRWSWTQKSLKVDFKVRDTLFQEYRLYLAEGTDKKAAKLVARKDFKYQGVDYFIWD